MRLSPAERERYHREWVAAGGPARAAAIRRARAAGNLRSYLRLNPLDPKLARLQQQPGKSDPKRRAKELLQKDRDDFLTRARHARRLQRLRLRAREILDPGAALHDDVERAGRRRELARDLRAAGWWYRLTGERTDDIL